MGVVEFEVTRTVHAPIDDVFARLTDINGYNHWMPQRGSIRRHSEQTSPGAPRVGTTYLDATAVGPTPGEITELDAPRVIVFHWWTKSEAGKLHAEGWPGYALSPDGPESTVVRHHATLQTYGSYRLATPMFRWMARRERTATIDALVASFEPH